MGLLKFGSLEEHLCGVPQRRGCCAAGIGVLVGHDEADLASAFKLPAEHTGTIEPHQLPNTHVIGIPKGELRDWCRRNISRDDEGEIFKNSESFKPQIQETRGLQS